MLCFKSYMYSILIQVPYFSSSCLGGLTDVQFPCGDVKSVSSGLCEAKVTWFLGELQNSVVYGVMFKSWMRRRRRIGGERRGGGRRRVEEK